MPSLVSKQTFDGTKERAPKHRSSCSLRRTDRPCCPFLCAAPWSTAEATAECHDRGAGVSQRVPTRLTDVTRCALQTGVSLTHGPLRTSPTRGVACPGRRPSAARRSGVTTCTPPGKDQGPLSAVMLGSMVTTSWASWRRPASTCELRQQPRGRRRTSRRPGRIPLEPDQGPPLWWGQRNDHKPALLVSDGELRAASSLFGGVPPGTKGGQGIWA